jgi:hypothetical protein
MSLLSASALARIRKIGEHQMTTEVRILRQAPVLQSPSVGGYDPNYDFGDDDDDFSIYEGSTYEGPSTTAFAWFFSTIQTSNEDVNGEIGTVDLHEIRLPVGTDVRVGDTIERVDNGEQYNVIDTNAGDTWAEKLRVNARRLE